MTTLRTPRTFIPVEMSSTVTLLVEEESAELAGTLARSPYERGLKQARTGNTDFTEVVPSEGRNLRYLTAPRQVQASDSNC